MTANGYTGAEVSITDVSGLEAELATKLEGPLTTADITGLVAALTAKLDAANGQIVNSTLIIRKGDWSAAMRLRSTGGAVDWDLSGTVVISSFAGTPEDSFAGTQTGLMRLRAGSGVTLAHLTEFGANEYAGDQYVHGDNGTALLNLATGEGMAAFRPRGRKGTAGAPTTGTWATGDAIIDSAKTWWYCTAGGTPGTWT